MFLFRSYAARQSWLLIIRCMWKAVQTVMSNQQDFRVFVAFSLLSGCFFVHRVYVACRTQIAHAVNVNRCWIGFVWPLFVHVTEAWFYRSQTARPPHRAAASQSWWGVRSDCTGTRWYCRLSRATVDGICRTAFELRCICHVDILMNVLNISRRHFLPIQRRSSWYIIIGHLHGGKRFL